MSADYGDMDDAFTLEVELPSAATAAGSLEEGEDESQNEEYIVPKYSTVFSDWLSEPSDQKATEDEDLNKKKAAGGMKCFNCLGEHSIAQCSLPRDGAAISRNRRAHASSRPPASIRYHALCSAKFSQLVAGRTSDALRDALGLQPHQLPEMVYRMRVIGYPPGWLMTARETHGDLMLIGGDGKAVCQPGGEDGEVGGGGAKYNPDQLIAFPGFNAPLPDGMTEEGRKYRVPRQQPSHSLTQWRAVMKRNQVTPYRKRKMNASNTGMIDSPSNTSSPPLASMAAGSDEEEKGAETLLEEGDVANKEEQLLPRTKKLKRAKQRKGDKQEKPEKGEDKEEETDAMFVLDTEPTIEPDSNSIKSSDASNDANKTNSNSIVNTDENIKDSKKAKKIKKDKKNKKMSRRSLSSVSGAVIPESITEYTELPTFDKWTVDVSDHILFENLPDAVGTWDNMRSIMAKVRTSLSKINSDAS